MIPGPDLDAEIARKVLGVVVILDTETGVHQLRDVKNKKFIPVPPYSTDTMTAHELVARFKTHGCTFKISPCEESMFSVTVSHPQIAGVNIVSKGSTLPHAICQAILQFNSLFKLARS
jgi:hypothetical protein